MKILLYSCYKVVFVYVIGEDTCESKKVGILQLLLSNFRVNGSFLLFVILLTVAYSALNPYFYLIFR